MLNDDTQATWDYHNGTKHPHGSLFDPTWVYEGSMRPFLFKVYPGLTPIPLLLDTSARGGPALQAIAVNDSTTVTSQPLDLSLLTCLLYFSAGITKHLRYKPTGITMPFRAAACTG